MRFLAEWTAGGGGAGALEGATSETFDSRTLSHRSVYQSCPIPPRWVYVVRPSVICFGSIKKEKIGWQNQTQCRKLQRRRPHVLVFVHRPLKRELSRKRLVLKTQRLVTLCSNSRSQRR